jgi:nitrogen fixation NifU-like protein
MKTDATTQDHHPHATGGLSPRFLGHANFPQGQHPMDRPDASASGIGSCGDRITVQIRLDDDTIGEISALPAGCVYTIACASALCGLTRGRSLNEALELQPDAIAEELGGLPPDHLHCARLAVNTLGEAIDSCLQKRWGRASSSPDS